MLKPLAKLSIVGVMTLVGWVGTAQATVFSTTFGPVYTFAAGGVTASTTLVGLPTAISGDMTIDMSWHGDVDSGASESFVFTIDGVSIGTVCNNNAGDDPFNHPTDVCTFPAFNSGVATIAPLLADGALTFAAITSSLVNVCCTTSTSTTASGVEFLPTSGFAMGFGGTLSFDAAATSVPEPTTTALLALGLLGAGFARKRRMY